MPNTSSITKSIATRIPMDVYAILVRRARKRGLKPSEYLRDFITKDVRRRR